MPSTAELRLVLNVAVTLYEDTADQVRRALHGTIRSLINREGLVGDTDASVNSHDFAVEIVDGNDSKFLVTYSCDRCHHPWFVIQDCTCNDRCPNCDAEVTPSEYYPAG